jgi:thiosulfate/3-mercaptopyruvate sulfurtransferase
VYVDLDEELARHGEPTDGRHPLPTASDLEESLRRWGVDEGDPVVVYDGASNTAAARAWWLLLWAGLTDVHLLDGALPAWVSAGLPMCTDDVVPERGSISVNVGQLPTLTAESVQGFKGVVVDARAAERYRGEQEPIDPKAGHVPGAVNLPTGGNLAADGTFLSPAALRERFAASGVDGEAPVAVYCGSGVTAAHEIAALAVAGIPAALYPGSWSQWSHLDLPVETSLH